MDLRINHQTDIISHPNRTSSDRSLLQVRVFPGACVYWNIALWTRLHSELLNISSSASGVSWMLSLTGNRGSGFLQEGSFSESFLNPKFFQSSLIFICNPGLFSALWWFLLWMLAGFLLSPLTLAGTKGLILVVERCSTELDLYSPGTWRWKPEVLMLFC